MLIIASMIEAEAKFSADRAKVARVVYNRLAARMPLGFDSTSAYGARLVGKDPDPHQLQPAGAVQHAAEAGPAADPDRQPGQRRR